MTAYSDRVYRLAYGVTRNEADAQEVAQDVFMTVFRKHASFEGRATLSSWIYRVTMNAALNKRRGKRRELETPLEEDLPTYRADGHRAGDRAYLLADWSRTPEAELLSGEARDVLTRAIEGLPDHYRAVLILRDVEGLSNDEVAATLDETVSSVKSRLHRARMVVREQLTRHFHARP
jgi:RNA polymerase sigma-70 factor (ECF subfamily)